MKAPYAKPHLSVPDQLALMEQRGMTVADRPRAMHYLSLIGYYRLSGYSFPARASLPGGAGRSDLFLAGTTFERTVELYVFDKRLRLLFMDALERIEVAIRVEAALQLSARDAFAHRDTSQLDGNFTKVRSHGRSRHHDWLDRLDGVTAQSKEEFVQRYRAKYSSEIPLWIAIELWDFGLLSRFIEGLKYADRTTVATRFGIPREDLLVSWVRTLNHVRNVCAHHSRLWNRVSTELPRLAPTGSLPLLDHLFANRGAHNRTYAAAAIIQHFMRLINPNSTWSDRLKKHAATFPAGPGIVFGHTGFPNGWESQPLWN